MIKNHSLTSNNLKIKKSFKKIIQKDNQNQILKNNQKDQIKMYKKIKILNGQVNHI